MDSNFPRINQLPPYVFDEIQSLKAAARKRGEDIIDFGMGNPDQSTPTEIVDKINPNLSCNFIDILLSLWFEYSVIL